MDESQVDVVVFSTAGLLPDVPVETEEALTLTYQERQAMLREMASLVALLHSAA